MSSHYYRQLIAIVVVVISILVYLNLAPITGPIVQTLDGKVRGIVSHSRHEQEYYQFLGIKYAKAPIGQKRFADPEPIEKYDGIFEANQFGPDCLQFDFFIFNSVVGHEDCLALHIFAPKVALEEKENSKLAVMVYLYGGMFMSGSSKLYKGGYLVDENVILVTLNYRVAALGFLTSGDDQIVPGNYGLKDQILALEWIQKNIEFFGGDPNRVTLFGESAGGSSSHIQQFTRHSDNLFSKVISMSGTAYRKYLTSSQLTNQFKNFAAKFECPTENSEETLQCLRQVEGSRLVQGHADAADILNANPYSVFGPTINPKFLEEPRNLVATGKFNKVPWITGIVKMEGLLYVARIIRDAEAVKKMNTNWIEELPKLLKYDPTRIDITNKIKNYYFPESQNNLNMETQIEQFSNLFSDRSFFQANWQVAKEQSKLAPVFVYYLTYKPKTNIYNLLTSIKSDGLLPAPLQFLVSMMTKWVKGQFFHVETFGPGHGDELSLLFDINFLVQVSNPQHVDWQFSQLFVQLWANIAKSQNGELVSFNGDLWLPVDPQKTEVTYMELNKDSSYHSNPENEDFVQRIKFWESLNL